MQMIFISWLFGTSSMVHYRGLAMILFQQQSVLSKIPVSSLWIVILECSLALLGTKEGRRLE